MICGIVKVLEERTGLALSCLAQAVSTLLAVLFLDISLSKYEVGSWYTEISLSIFMAIFSALTICPSVIAIFGKKQDRGSIYDNTHLKEEKGHKAIVLWTFLFLVLNFLCQAGMIAGLNIRWEFTEIMTLVFDGVCIISFLFTVVVIVQKRV